MNPLLEMLARFVVLVLKIVGVLGIAITVVLLVSWMWLKSATDAARQLVRSDQLVVENWNYANSQMHVRVRNTSEYVVKNFTLRVKFYDCSSTPQNSDLQACDYLSTDQHHVITRGAMIPGYAYTHSMMLGSKDHLRTRDPNIRVTVVIMDVMAEE